MNINDLIGRYNSDRRNKIKAFQFDNNDPDGVIEQLDKVVVYGIASGSLGDGFRLPKLSDTRNDALRCSRGSLYLFYDAFRKRVESYLGKSGAELDADDPTEQIENHVVSLKYSENFFSLVEQFFIEGLDLKSATSPKKDKPKTYRDENNPGLLAEIDRVINQCVALRYPKQKIIQYFHEQMSERFFDLENRKLYSRLSTCFQDRYRRMDYSATVRALNALYDRDLCKKDKGEMLITDVTVPYLQDLCKHWNVTYFDGRNGLSFSSLNFEKGAKEYKKYDVIFCPNHTFSEALLSADSMIGFLLTVKNKLNEGGRLIINTFDPDEEYIERAKQRNVQVKFDVKLTKEGEVTYTDGSKGHCADKTLYEDLCARIPAETDEATREAKKEKWKTASIRKTSNFIHCDLQCNELKNNLGLDPNDASVKVWSLFEELKYVATYEGNTDVEPELAEKMSFDQYMERKNDYLDDCVIMRNLIEYVLIDPASFKKVLVLCGFDATTLDVNLQKEYTGEGSKEINYVCSIKK